MAKMEFDKNHKAKLETIENEVQAKAYCNFLAQERIRHLNTLNSCRIRIKIYGVDETPGEFYETLTKLWNSEVLRQQEEIDKLDNRARRIKEKWGL